MMHEMLQVVNQAELLKKPVTAGASDVYGNLRLRVGMIDLPDGDRGTTDPIDPKRAVNMITGKVIIRWIDGMGGIMGPPGDPKQGKYGDLDNNAQSDVEMVKLTHPMIWTGVDKCGVKRWCGFHYLPPVGSIVIVGFRKSGLPVLLGYLQNDFSVCRPIKLGEAMMKGYGNNWTYWQQNHVMEHRAWVNVGDTLNNDCGNKATEGRTFKIVLDAEQQNIIISGEDTEGNNSSIAVRPEDILFSASDGSNTSSITISPASIQMYTTGTFTVTERGW